MKIDLTGIDTTKPNPGRIYDYFLGGEFNLPIDRATAKALDKVTPRLGQGIWLNRFFMFEAIKRLAEAGLDNYIDLATGLPTQGYLHDRLPTTTRIVYNDIDPTTVLHGQQVVVDHPNVRYVQSDIRDIDTILDAGGSFFGADQRRVGICMVGIAYFIESEHLERIFRALYNWSAPGSLLAFSMFNPDPDDPASQAVADKYAKVAQPIYLRTETETMNLIGPWEVLEIQPLETYAESELQGPVLNDPIRSKMGFGGFLIR